MMSVIRFEDVCRIFEEIFFENSSTLPQIAVLRNPKLSTMISVKSLIVTLLVGTIVAVDGFAPKPFDSLSTRLFAEDETAPLPLPPWKGGHKESYPDFAYTPIKPDLSREEMVKNLDNIPKITRMQKIMWPEFSWYSKLGDESSRVYTCFAQDVSRIGYDDEGKIWSFVCPQRGISLATFGTVFIEVTVTGVRGWVDEETRSVYADVEVEANVWVQPQLGNPLVQALKQVFDLIASDKALPFSKANAVKVAAHQVGKPYESIWPMVNGTDPTIFQPVPHRHYDDGAYSAYHLQVEVGKRVKKDDPLVDRFHELVYNLFNEASGGIVVEGQIVAWNVWPTEPEGVDTEEWKGHADKWFNSIHNEHQYPDGQDLDDSRELAYFDGTPYESEFELQTAVDLMKEFLDDVITSGYLDEKKKEIVKKHPLLSFVGYHLLRKRKDHVKK